jgi:hypothetical protein
VRKLAFFGGCGDPLKKRILTHGRSPPLLLRDNAFLAAFLTLLVAIVENS